MFYIPDYCDRWEQHDRQKEKELDMLPKCCECGEAIQSEYCFEINDEFVCERCLIENHRKNTEDLVM